MGSDTHCGHRELHFFPDIVRVEFCVTEVFRDVEGDLPMLGGANDPLLVTERGDGSLKDDHRGQADGAAQNLRMFDVEFVV